MHQHPLDAILERYRTRTTSPARAFERQFDQAVPVRAFAEPVVLEIATVLLNGRSNPRIQQFFNLCDRFGIAFQYPRILRSVLAVRRSPISKEGRARSKVFNDETVDFRFHRGPVGVHILGNGNEIGSEEDGPYARDAEEGSGEWRGEGGGGSEEFVS